MPQQELARTLSGAADPTRVPFGGFVLYNKHITVEVGQMLARKFSEQLRASTLGCEVSLQGTTTWILKAERKVFIADRGCIGNSPKPLGPEPYRHLSFMYKTHLLVGTLQLARSRTIETKRQGQYN